MVAWKLLQFRGLLPITGTLTAYHVTVHIHVVHRIKPYPSRKLRPRDLILYHVIMLKERVWVYTAKRMLDVTEKVALIYYCLLYKDRPLLQKWYVIDILVSYTKTTQLNGVSRNQPNPKPWQLYWFQARVIILNLWRVLQIAVWTLKVVKSLPKVTDCQGCKYIYTL